MTEILTTNYLRHTLVNVMVKNVFVTISVNIVKKLYRVLRFVETKEEEQN